MHLQRLDFFVRSFGGSLWYGGSNAVPFSLLDNDNCFPLRASLFTRHDQHKDAVSPLWHCGYGNSESVAGKGGASLVSLLFERSGLRSLDELRLHSHHFLDQLVWLDFRGTPNKQHHNLQRARRRRAYDGRRTINEA